MYHERYADERAAVAQDRRAALPILTFQSGAVRFTEHRLVAEKKVLKPLEFAYAVGESISDLR